MAELPTRSDGRTIGMAWFNDVKKVLQGIGSVANDTLQFPVIGTTIPSRVAGKLFRDSDNKLKIATSTGGSGDRFVSETAQAAATAGRIFKASGANQVAEVQDQATGWLDASSAITPLGQYDAGASLILVESATQRLWYELRFNASETSYAQWTFALPDNIDLSNIELTVIWKAVATSGNVRWAFSYQARGDGDPWDSDSVAFGSAGQSLADSTSEETNEFSRSGSISGSSGDSIRVRVARQGGNSSDTMSGDAKVLGIKVKIGLSH